MRFDEYAKSGKLPKLTFDRSGWFLIRAVTNVPKTYRFAMTGPYYVEIGYQRRISKSAAQFFLDWVYQRAKQIKLADPQQQQEVLQVAPPGAGFLAGLALEGQRGIARQPTDRRTSWPIRTTSQSRLLKMPVVG